MSPLFAIGERCTAVCDPAMAGDITVAVQVQNIPDGTPVRLRVTMVGGVDIRLVTFGHPFAAFPYTLLERVAPVGGARLSPAAAATRMERG